MRPVFALLAATIFVAAGCVDANAPDADFAAAEQSAADQSADDQTVARDAPGPPPTPANDVANSDEASRNEAGQDEAAEPVIASPPRLVEIPTIDVEAEIIDLGLHDDGSLQTPDDFAQAGWWAGGPTAVESGPTVIVGHVDSYTGPAVFFRLAELTEGDHIVVTDAHGASHRFRVTEVDLYDKDEFPTERVYGDTDESTLRLVTCGGDFDDRARSYEANWVVFASPVA